MSRRRGKKHYPEPARPVARVAAVERVPASLRYGALRINASYDAASTTRHNENHWKYATHLSAAAEANPQVRAQLRNRARYEVRNNSYAIGICDTLAGDVIGRGPRLQMLTPDREFNAEAEAKFEAWARAVRLGEKMRLVRTQVFESGEAFGVMTTNPLSPHPVKLDLILVEPDRITSPFGHAVHDETHYDGIDYDTLGNPLAYSVLKHHPGDSFGSMAFDKIPAWAMIHLFKERRPGQKRGVPDVTPSLPNFAVLRRFTLATLTAAENAANFTAVMQQTNPGDAISEEDYSEVREDLLPVPSFDPMDIERNTMLTLPVGATMNQFRAEHPNATFQVFKHEMIGECARCVSMPLNIALCNSSSYNYASGRMDHQTYHKMIRIEQDWFGNQFCDRLLAAFLSEATRIDGFFSPRFVRLYRQLFGSFAPVVLHEWFFDGAEHVDPQKEANAQATRLASRTTTRSHEAARQGRDWEADFRQLAREDELQDELTIQRIVRRRELLSQHGLTEADLPNAAPAPLIEQDTDEDEPETDEETDDEKKSA